MTLPQSTALEATTNMVTRNLKPFCVIKEVVVSIVKFEGSLAVVSPSENIVVTGLLIPVESVRRPYVSETIVWLFKFEDTRPVPLSGVDWFVQNPIDAVDRPNQPSVLVPPVCTRVPAAVVLLIVVSPPGVSADIVSMSAKSSKWSTTWQTADSRNEESKPWIVHDVYWV